MHLRPSGAGPCATEFVCGTARAPRRLSGQLIWHGAVNNAEMLHFLTPNGPLRTAPHPKGDDGLIRPPQEVGYSNDLTAVPDGGDDAAERHILPPCAHRRGQHLREAPLRRVPRGGRCHTPPKVGHSFSKKVGHKHLLPSTMSHFMSYFMHYSLPYFGFPRK